MRKNAELEDEVAKIEMLIDMLMARKVDLLALLRGRRRDAVREEP